MDKIIGKLVLLLCVLGFGVFYGVSISKDGIEQIHGPIDGTTQTANKPDNEVQSKADTEKQAVQAQARLVKKAPLTDLETIRPRGPWFVTLLDKLGQMLNWIADHLIRMLVRLGEAVLS